MNDLCLTASLFMTDCGCCRERISDPEAEKIAFDIYKEIDTVDKRKHKLLRTKLSKSKTAVSKKEAQV